MDFEKYLDDSYEVITGEGLYKINGGAEKDGVSGAGTPEYYTRHGGAPVSPTSNTESGGSTPTASSGGKGNKENKNKDEMECGYVVDKEGAGGAGHGGMYVETEKGFSYFEVNGLVESDKVGKRTKDDLQTILSIGKVKFPSPKVAEFFGFNSYAGVIQRDFGSREEMFKYFKYAGDNGGYDYVKSFKVTKQEGKQIYDTAISDGKAFKDYSLIGNSCGIWAKNVLTTEGSGINTKDLVSKVGLIASFFEPRVGATILLSNMTINSIPNLIMGSISNSTQEYFRVGQ